MALRRYGQVFLSDNPAMRVPGRVLWCAPHFRPSVRSEQDLVDRFSVQVCIPPGVYPDRAACDAVWKAGLAFESDAYFSATNTAIGSGRSVFVEEHQLKGVGRTCHATFHDFTRDVDGALTCSNLVRELRRERWLRALLRRTPFPHDFVLTTNPDAGQTSGEPPRLLLARRGSPLRIGHIVQLLPASFRWPPDRRPAFFRSFLRGLYGSSAELSTEASLLEKLVHVVTLACERVAEARVFSLVNPDFWDNADLFSRGFDTETVVFAYPDHRCGSVDVVAALDQVPRTWFQNLDVLAGEDHEVRALVTLHGAFLAVDVLLQGLALPPRHFDQRLDWPTLNGIYQRELVRVLARTFGLDSSPILATVTPLLEALARERPLLPTAGDNQPGPARLLDAYRSGLRGHSVAGSIQEGLASRLGSVVADALGPDARRDIEQGTQVLESWLDGASFKRSQKQLETAVQELFVARDWEGLRTLLGRCLDPAAD